MIYHAINVISDVFTKMKSLLSSFEVADGVSYWSILIVSLISFGVIGVLATATGARGISGMISGSVGSIRSSEVRAKQNKTK